MSTNRRKFISRSVSAAAGAAFACTSIDTTQKVSAPQALPVDMPRDDDEFWKLVRRQFPLTDERVYFNTGGLGPAPYPVLDALHETTMQLQRVSETGHRRLDTAREHVAEFFGASPSEIAFTRNATEGNATIASGLKLSAGDEVVFESHAHPGGAMAWMVRQKEEGIKVRIFDPSPESPEENVRRLRGLINDNTRVVQVSHITAPTGIRMPVGEMADVAHEAGAWFHVDGAQSAGMVEFNLHDIGCDSYATSGHKWLGAPHGTGFLFVTEDRLSDIVPTEAGAYSNAEYELPDVFEYNPTAQRFESGTRNAAQVVGIQAAIEFQNHIGADRIEAYVVGLGRYLRESLEGIDGLTILSPRGAGLDTAMTTFKLEAMRYDDLYRVLVRDHKLRCRIVTERGLDGLRVSTHMFNSKSECDRLVEAVQNIVANPDG